MEADGGGQPQDAALADGGHAVPQFEESLLIPSPPVDVDLSDVVVPTRCSANGSTSPNSNHPPTPAFPFAPGNLMECQFIGNPANGAADQPSILQASPPAPQGPFDTSSTPQAPPFYTNPMVVDGDATQLAATPVDPLAATVETDVGSTTFPSAPSKRSSRKIPDDQCYCTTTLCECTSVEHLYIDGGNDTQLDLMEVCAPNHLLALLPDCEDTRFILPPAVYPPSYKEGASVISQNVAAAAKKLHFEMIVARSEGPKKNGVQKAIRLTMACNKATTYRQKKKLAEESGNEGNEESSSLLKDSSNIPHYKVGIKKDRMPKAGNLYRACTPRVEDMCVELLEEDSGTVAEFYTGFCQYLRYFKRKLAERDSSETTGEYVSCRRTCDSRQQFTRIRGAYEPMKKKQRRS